MRAMVNQEAIGQIKSNRNKSSLGIRSYPMETVLLDKSRQPTNSIPHTKSTPGIEPGTQWWTESAAPTLLPGDDDDDDDDVDPDHVKVKMFCRFSF